MTLLELLRAGKIEEFNSKRGVHNAPDLFAEDLAGLDLRGADLNGANLEKADLSEADLRGVNLARANLNGADLTEAKMQGAVAVQARMRGAYIDQADLEGADLTSADLREAVLTSSDAAGIVLRRAKLRGADLTDARMADACFAEAKLDNADLSGAYMERADFSEANLSGACLDKATLEGANFTSARAANASFQRAKLAGANFERCDLTAAALDEADLSGASLHEADLTEATLEGANMEGVKLSGAVVDGALAQAADEQVPAIPDAPAQIVTEDLRGAVLGKRVALLWENEEDGTTLKNRLAVVVGDSFDGNAPALGGPAEITLAREVVEVGKGFAAVLLLERPTGVELQITWVDAKGRRRLQTERLGFEPAVRPMILGGERLRIVGLGRRGPTLHIVEVLPEGGMREIKSVPASTARGLVGGLQPVLLTRGGAVHRVLLCDQEGRAGISPPLPGPPRFELRGAAACVIDKDVVLCWLPIDKKGLSYAHLAAGERPETLVALPKEVVLAADLCVVKDQPVVFVLREDGARGGASGLWRIDLSERDAAPTPVFCKDAYDLETMRVIGVQAGQVTLLCTTLSEQIVVLRTTAKGAKILCEL